MEAIPSGHDRDYSPPAVQGVLSCNKLFEYERSYKAKGLSYAQTSKRRQKDQRPVVEGFLPLKTGAAASAINYQRNQSVQLPLVAKFAVQRKPGRSKREHGSIYHGKDGKNDCPSSMQLPEIPA